MTVFNLPDKDEREIRIQKRVSELEKNNQYLRAENMALSLDITKCKKAEEALRESEERFRALVTASSEVLYRMNPDWSEMRQLHSRGFLANTERPNRNWLQEYIHPDDQPQVTAVINEAIRTKSIFEMEHRVRRADGSLGWTSSRAVPLMDANGEIIEWFGAASDITERKRAEEALKRAHDNLEERVKERTIELEEAYESLVENEIRLNEAQKIAHLGNWDQDILTNKLYWSDEVYRIYGLDPLESGITYDSFLNYVHPDDRDYVNNAVKEALSGKPYGIDFRIISADGQERIVHSLGEVIFDEKHTPVRARGIVQDITERKKAEEKIQRLANVVESSDDSILTLSLEGIITSWNKGAEQVYGYSAEEILGKTFSILEPANLKGEMKKLIEEIKNNEKVRYYETLRLKKDGALKNVSITLSPVFNSSGKLVAVSTIARDITERKQEEHRIRRYNHILEGINLIFGSVVRAETEEELGNECLSVVLEVTGSQIGFVGEVGADGLLHDIAISDMGWSQCLMYDKTGHRRPPGDFILHGLYGCVIDKGKSFFTNEPQLHPNSIGLPHGHPPITSFLGVPLVQDGKTVGTIAVANREGGYSSEQQEDLEAIAPAVTQALQRRKAEETLAKIDIARQKEIHHRIKNNLQVISSLLDLTAERFNNRECIQDFEVLKAFRESQDRVISMALIHEELYKGEGFETLNFSPYIEELVKNLLQTYAVGNLDINLKLDLKENAFFDMDTAIPLGIIVNELVSNSLKHAFPGRSKGEIRIELHREENGE